MQVSLESVAQIRFGLYVQQTVDTGIAYLQARQFDSNGNLVTQQDTFLPHDNKVTAHLLKDGDILLVGKGSKNFAWCYKEEFGPAVASSIFFVISPDKKKIQPEYITALLNHNSSQEYFQKQGLGTNIMSIRRSELEDFKIALLPMAQQASVAALHELHKKEVIITQLLLQRKNEFYEAVVNNLINGNLINNN